MHIDINRGPKFVLLKVLYHPASARFRPFYRPMNPFHPIASNTSEHHPRSFKRPRPDESHTYTAYRLHGTPSPPPFESLGSVVTPPLCAIPAPTQEKAIEDDKDTSTCFGSSPDASDISYDANHPPTRVPFWPNRGSRRTKVKVAGRYGAGTIWELPPSAVSVHKTRQMMRKNDVRIRLRELFGIEGRPVQVDTVYEVGCRGRSMILTAKTAIGKSAIFEAIPLLDPSNPGIALVVMPLKHIQQQQLEKINNIPGAQAVVYDGDHCDEHTRWKIAAGHYTHGEEHRYLLSYSTADYRTVFISPELVLTKKFHEDVVKSDLFRSRIAVFAIDELHCVENWKSFRPKYSELGVLKARLPPTPYLGVTATLGHDKEDTIKTNGGFDPDCPVVRTSVDRPEISIHVIFAEGNLNTFDDLRRFFPMGSDIRHQQDIPKTVFYFDSIRLLLAFVKIVRSFWLPEFGYPPESVQWIQPYFSIMAEFDKGRIAAEFEKPDSPTDSELCSNIRFLVASEGYGMGADNPDICYVIQFRIPKELDSLVQRKGRAKRNGRGQGRFFIIADRFASEKPLSQKPNRYMKHRRHDPTMDYLVNSQTESEAEVGLPTTNSKASKIDAERRLKQQPAMIRFLNPKECHRLEELNYYGDLTYHDSTRSRPMECCSRCNPGLIPPFRTLPVPSQGNILFETWIVDQLYLWRAQQAQDLTRGTEIPALGSIVLPDRIVKKIARYPREIVADGGLHNFCSYWPEMHLYNEQILRICRFAAEPVNWNPGGVVYQADRERINRIPMSRRKIQPVLPPPLIPTEAEEVTTARQKRRNAFLIQMGHAEQVKRDTASKKGQGLVGASRTRDGSLTPVTSQTSYPQEVHRPQSAITSTLDIQVLDSQGPEIEVPDSQEGTFQISSSQTDSGPYSQLLPVEEEANTLQGVDSSQVAARLPLTPRDLNVQAGSGRFGGRNPGGRGKRCPPAVRGRNH